MNTSVRRLAGGLSLAMACLWLTACQPDIVIPTLVPSLTPISQFEVLQTQVSASMTAATPTPAPPTITLTPTPTHTATPTSSSTPTATATATPTSTHTPTFTSTATPVPPTSTATATSTSAPTQTATVTPTPTIALTPTSTRTPGLAPATLIENASFEFGYTLSPLQQQMPNGWLYTSTAAGQTLPFPTKLQQGAVLPAYATDQAESQLFTSDQLPADERLGQPRALILDGNTVLRTHGAWRASATVLKQTLKAPPGATVRVVGYILAESLEPGTKENDSMVAAVRLYGASGAIEDKRLLAQMVTRSDVANSSRHWNRFEVAAVVPASGLLPLEIILQQNWDLGGDWFFIDNFSAAMQLP